MKVHFIQSKPQSHVNDFIFHKDRKDKKQNKLIRIFFYVFVKYRPVK